MRYVNLVFYFLIYYGKSYSQGIATNLESKFHSADSIILIKHLSTNSPIIVDDRTGKSSKQRRLFSGNRLNNAIVTKRKKIDSNQISSLLNLLIAQESKISRQTMQCFIPRHAIIIYKQHKISYIDICFECLNFETSADIIFGKYVWDRQKWSKLQKYFSNLKL